jgi:Flp pilus assembly protein TadG
MRTILMRVAGRAAGSRGQALIELAVTLMLLVILMMGVFDYSRAIHAQSVITNMSREGANLIARSNPHLSGDEAVDFQNVLDLIGKTAQPLNMTQYGMMYIYKVERVNNVNTITRSLGWNRSSASPKPAMSGSASSLGGVTLAAGQVAYGFEVYYKYNSIFLGTRFAPTLKSISVF